MTKHNYIVLIDESGNTAFDKFLDGKGYGADNHLNFGAAIIKAENVISIKNSLTYIKDILKKQKLHFTEISTHYEKLFVLEEISSNVDFTAFTVISNKKTLTQGNGKAYIPRSYSEFYHKNLCYLLERINGYLYHNKIKEDEVLFVIEESPTISLGELKNYITVIRKDKNNFYIPNININNIIVKNKQATDLLFLADIVASSVRHITFGHFFDGKQIIEPRYLHILLPHFYKKDDSYEKGGIKLVHTLKSVCLCDAASDFIKNIL